MTDQTHTRLSDGAMAKVIAEWMGWDKASWQTPARSTDSMTFHNSDVTAEQIPAIDPRTHTDAALRLLIYLVHTKGCALDSHTGDCIGVSEWDSSELVATLPISGKPFCNAVCNLAAKVLGVEGGE